MNRECNGCTKCCEGWLHGTAYGKPFWPGRKCHFCKVDGCSIYKDRPNFCQEFECAWLRDDFFPEWMKPDVCGLIMRWLEIDGIRYLDIIEAGSRIDPTILSWLVIAYANGEIPNMRWSIDGGNNMIGTREFIKAMDKKNE